MISVIIPIYNVEEYLSGCLNSVKAQTFPDFEVLMINDGSKDSSKKIAESFLTDNRFKLYNQDNQGQGAARNLGLDNAKGEYICFVDSDDQIEPEYLKKLHSLLTSSDADISQCGVSRVWENGRKEPYSYTGLESRTFTDISDYLKDCSFVMWNKLYKRNLFDNLRFPVGIKFEDFALAPQVYERAKKIVSTDSCLYNYLWRSNSTTTIARVQPDIFKAQQHLEKSDFGKRNPDILNTYFVRQVICSMLWGMLYKKSGIPEARRILDYALCNYSRITACAADNKVPPYKMKWLKYVFNNQLYLAHKYVQFYEVSYRLMRKIYHLFK